MDGGVSPSTIFCNGQQTQTATGSPSAKKTGGSATNSAGASPSTGAAPGLTASQSVSKAGLGMLGMMVVSVFVGAMI
jgi:hypothetical protein